MRQLKECDKVCRLCLFCSTFSLVNHSVRKHICFVCPGLLVDIYGYVICVLKNLLIHVKENVELRGITF